MIEWLLDNKQWIFSGIGVLLLSAAWKGAVYLRRLKPHWAVSPGKVERVDVTYSDCGEEVAWIKANQAKYKGKWVMLLGGRVLGMGDDLKTAMRMVQEQQYEGTPLIHHLE